MLHYDSCVIMNVPFQIIIYRSIRLINYNLTLQNIVTCFERELFTPHPVGNVLYYGSV